jgi:hypothetical protein
MTHLPDLSQTYTNPRPALCPGLTVGGKQQA